MNVALILAGGTGSRLGEGIPKQYRKVKDRAIIQYGLDVLIKSTDIHGVWIVADEAWRNYIVSGMDEHAKKFFWGFSSPGSTRQQSILNGLEDIHDLKKQVDYVLIHDAARPLVELELLDSCFMAIKGHQGVMPVLSMKDTVYYSEDGNVVSSLLKRQYVFAGQAPELFAFEDYYQANRALSVAQMVQINGSTEPAILAGMDIVMIPGQESNFKITTMADLVRFCEIIERRLEVR